MSEILNGDLPAFARSYSERTSETYPDALSAWSQVGLTKREIFAMAAMQGICANPQILINAKNSGKPIDEDGTAVTDAIARVSVQQADALLTQLSKQQ